MPVTLAYDFTPHERFGLVLSGGTGLSFRTGCQLGIRPFGGSMTTIDCGDVPGVSFKSFDLGVIGGGALRMTLGREQIVAGMQYELGLTKIESSTDAKNRALTFSLGVELPIR
jgi:hypothetical protein